jgi:DNA-binding MarR family transcriptional regulator
MLDVATEKAARKPRSNEFEMDRESFRRQLAQDHSHLSPSALAIGIILAGRFNREIFYDKGGLLIAWPGLETLAKETGMEVRTVRRAIRRLQARGHVRIVEGGGGRGKSHRYMANIKGKATLRLVPKPGQPVSLNPGNLVLRTYEEPVTRRKIRGAT